MITPFDWPAPIARPHNPLSVQLSKAVIIGLLPVCIWAYATRPTAAVGSASIHKPLGPANSAAESHGIHAQGIVK